VIPDIINTSVVFNMNFSYFNMVSRSQPNSTIEYHTEMQTGTTAYQRFGNHTPTHETKSLAKKLNYIIKGNFA